MIAILNYFKRLQAMSDQRDDATNDKIDLRSKMKEIIKIQRERKGKLSYDNNIFEGRTSYYNRIRAATCV